MTTHRIPDPDSLEAFLGLLRRSLDAREFVKLVLGKPAGPDRGGIRVSARLVGIRGQERLSFLCRHETRDITENATIPEGIGKIRGLLAGTFRHAHLFTATQDVQWFLGKKGKGRVSKRKATHEGGGPFGA